MKNIKVEIATAEDAESIAKVAYQVAQLHDEALPEYFKPVPEEEQLRGIQNMLKDEKIVVFKAIYNGKIRGFLFLEMLHRVSQGLRFSTLGQVLNLGVDEKYRGRGLGAALLKFAEEYVYEQNGEALDLSVFAFNEKAIRFYKNLGYEVLDVSMRKILK